MTKEELMKVRWLKQYHYLREQATSCEERIQLEIGRASCRERV